MQVDAQGKGTRDYHSLNLRSMLPVALINHGGPRPGHGPLPRSLRPRPSVAALRQILFRLNLHPFHVSAISFIRRHSDPPFPPLHISFDYLNSYSFPSFVSLCVTDDVGLLPPRPPYSNTPKDTRKRRKKVLASPVFSRSGRKSTITPHATISTKGSLTSSNHSQALPSPRAQNTTPSAKN